MGRNKFFSSGKWLFLILIYSSSFSQIILNEMMIDPSNENTGEFIELYNTSDSIIDLSNFYICDEQDTDKLIPFPDSILPPHQYAIILDPNYEGEYLHILPDTSYLLCIDDSRFGKYGISNSTEKTFSLLDNNKQILDKYRSGTPEWPKTNYTIERYYPYQDIWRSSILKFGSPCRKNTISPQDKSINITNVSSKLLDDSLEINFTILNNGTSLIDHIVYSISLIFDNLSTEINQTLTDSVEIEITPFDSITITRHFPIFCKGKCTTQAIACYDECIDTFTSFAHIPLAENDMIINEFVCKPRNNFSCEYIELISKCSLPIQLYGLKFFDLTDFVVLDTNYILMPDSLVVIAQSMSFYDDFPFVTNTLYPSAWRSLNNSEDLIHITNNDISSICYLQYDNNWDLADDCAMLLVDTTLDYRNPRHWEVSQDGSPGKPNISEQQLTQLSCYSSRNYYTIKDTFAIFIINNGFLNTDALSFRVNEEFLTLPPLAPGDSFLCYPDTSRYTTEGYNYIDIECEPYFLHHIKYYRPYSAPPCFLNEIMFDPLDTYSQAEFIELESIHSSLDLSHWKIRINKRTVELSDSLHSAFSVFCSDNNTLGWSSNTYEYSTFPSLPNSGAEIYLLDPMDRIIDFCDFRDHKKIIKGRSLEKQFTGISSSDTELWHASVAESGMSPGYRNSISAHPSGRNSLGVYPKIYSPDNDGNIQFSVDSESGLEYCELSCFNLAGKLIVKKTQNCFMQSSAMIFWDGKLSDKSYLQRGVYLISCKLFTLEGKILRLKDSFVVK